MAGISLDEIILDNQSAIKIQDSAGDELNINADGSLDVSFATGSEIQITDGTETLLINVDGSLNAVVTATDLDVRDLSAAQDNVAISDGTETLAINVDGSLNAVVSATDLDIRDLAFATDSVDVSGSSVTVSATDLDIRDLTGATDSVNLNDGTNSLSINADGSLNVNLTDDSVADGAADTGNPFKVGGRAVSGALTAVDSGDRYDLLGDLYRRTYVNSSRNISMLNSQASVTTAAAEVLATPLAGRREVTIQNEGSQSVYIGSSALVTAANGIKISKNSSATFEFGEDINIFMIADSGTQDVRFLESA